MKRFFSFSKATAESQWGIAIGGNRRIWQLKFILGTRAKVYGWRWK